MFCAGPVTAAHLPIPEMAGGRCPLCGMGFRDDAPPADGPGGGGHGPGGADQEAGTDAGDVELLRCPDCGRRYWTDPHGPGGHCIVGLLPGPEGGR